LAESQETVPFLVYLRQIAAGFLSLVQNLLNEFQSRLRSFTTSLSVNSIAVGTICLWTLIFVAANTRAIVSPFYYTGTTWVIVGVLVFIFTHYFSRKISSKESVIQASTSMYVSLFVIYLTLAVLPSLSFFQSSIVMSPLAVVTILFLSGLTGALTGDLAQTDSLGDSFFRHHILPQMQNKSNPISLLRWAPNGEVSLVSPNEIRINWNTKVQHLMLNKLPLEFYAPVFVRNRHITSAAHSVIQMMEDLPLPRQKPMHSYKTAFSRGAQRVGDLYMVQTLMPASPHLLSRHTDFISLQRTKLKLRQEPGHHDISWSVRKTPWAMTYTGGKEALPQALDPLGQYLNKSQLKDLELAMAEKNMPYFSSESPHKTVLLHRSITNFILYIRSQLVHEDTQRGELYMRVMQDCLVWLEDIKSKPTFQAATPSSISLEQWSVFFDSIELEPSSAFMRVYNWLVAQIDDKDSHLLNFSSKASRIIDEGLERVRSSIAQPLPSSAEGFRLNWQSEGGLDRKIALYSVLCRWIFFSSLFTDAKELPI
tara:strand:- start:1192 stop:2805 length:1614 start_codon:yes stop_codon:yes gene_type:complete